MQSTAEKISTISTAKIKKRSEQHGAASNLVISSELHLGTSSDFLPTTGRPSKRARLSPSSINTADMNIITGKASQPRIIDLTRPPQFTPQSGVKRLVVRNLRPVAPETVERYYEQKWEDLDAALVSIYHGQPTLSPLETLCRGVEAICRRGDAQRLFDHLKERSRTYLEKKLLPGMQDEVGSHVDALKTVHKYWTMWNKKATLVRSIFSYLDRSYLLNAKDLPQLEALSIQQFRQAVFGKSKTVKPSHQYGEKAIKGMCDLVEADRLGDPEFDASLLKEAVEMLHILGIYGKAFESFFLLESKKYFAKFVQDQTSKGMKSYISACDNLLSKETTRCDKYNFDGVTKARLLTSSYRITIEQCFAVLLAPDELATLIEENDTTSLKALYGLLGRLQMQQNIKAPFEQYIKSVGSAIIRDKDKVDSMIVRLLELKRSLDLIIRDSFGRDESFTYSLREAFGSFMNDRKNTVVYGSNSSKVGEMIAKYLDLLLRGGVKVVPRSLTFDAIDRAQAEKDGQASTGDEEAELYRQLELGLELFRFIEGKDVFEAFYKKDLARRFLLARSASHDAEQRMLAKLKNECGHHFTQNLEQMFKDQQLSRDEMTGYKDRFNQGTHQGSNHGVDLQVSVLCASAWPTYPDVHIKIPANVAARIEQYDSYYKSKHTGRKLTWKHSLAHSIVVAQFSKGQKELFVSGFQAIILVLFNDLAPDGHLSYATIASATGLIDSELKRTLQSLACAKIRVLTKHPRGREIANTDTFTVNLAFSDPKYRIKINQIQLKETKEENKDTHEKVYQDRQFETQAAIVRIMKSRKVMSHTLLVGEVIEQMKKRGAVEVSEIKKNVEKLLEKDYIEREGDDYNYLA